MLSQETLREKLMAEVPDWVGECEDSTANVILMHQSALGADHRQSEIELLGWAIKYAGMRGKTVTVVPN